MRNVELLAPVGSWEALEAAVQSGANAVYLGGKAFNARQSANNFDENQLIKAVEYCHLRDVRIYITVNTLVSNAELKDLADYLFFLYTIDVDAVIIQDLGVAKLIRDLIPNLEIHGSTQMSTHNAQGVKALEKMGFSRVVLDREMSLKEIQFVSKNSEIDLEVFVHGALCVSYSGQCLMSSMIGGRSGNRGRCAQPCRMPYTLMDMDNDREIKGKQGSYLLSPRDLNTLENMDKILDTEVKSLKIEGRLKRPEYVATVVRAYRRAIDQYLATKELIIDKKTLQDVEQIFNRGFTKGYILGDEGKSLMSFSKPSNRGIKVGEVVFYDKKRQKAGILLDSALRKGDGVEFWTNKGDSPGAIVENIFIQGKKVETASAGAMVEIPFRHSAIKGQKVYKTSDVELLSEARRIYENKDKDIPIYGEFKAEIGSAMEVLLWDDGDNLVHIQSPYIVEKAKTVAIAEERVEEQLSKLGNTPYVLKVLKINLAEGAAIPIGQLNKLRRTAIDELSKKRLYHNRPIIDQQKFMSDFEHWFTFEEKKSNSILELRVSVGNLDQLKAVLDQEVDRIYYRQFSTFDKAVEIAADKNCDLIPVLPRVVSDDRINYGKSMLSQKLKGVMVGDLGGLYALSASGVPIYTDFSLNVFNSGAVNLLRKLGVEHITLSPELTLKQMKDILKRNEFSSEAIVHGHLPVMVTKYCPVSTVMGKGKKQESCNLCRNTVFGLKDRLGHVFPLESNDHCTVEILNAQKLCLIDHINDLKASGLSSVRIHFTKESENEIIETIQAYKEALNAPSSESSFVKAFSQKIKRKGYTKGHFFRGVK